MLRRDVEKQILKALLGDAKRSDHAIAKDLPVSQPTVTRVRQRFEKKGIIEKYLALPNFKKLGFEVIAFSRHKFNDTVCNDGNVVFAGRDDLRSKESELVTVSIHRNLSEYVKFARDSEAKPLSIILTSDIMKTLTLKGLIKNEAVLG